MRTARVANTFQSELAAQFLRIWAGRGVPTAEVAKRMGWRAGAVHMLIQRLMTARTKQMPRLPNITALYRLADALGYKMTVTLEETHGG